MGKPITDVELEAIRLHHAAGLSLSATAKLLGRAVSSTRLASQRLGLSWDRAKTAAATAALVTDMASRRAALAQNLLDDAERLRAQMWKPAVVYAFGGKDNEYNEHPVDEPPAGDKRTLMQAATTAMTAHLRLVDHATKDSHDDARDVVLQFGIAVRGAQLPDNEPPADG